MRPVSWLVALLALGVGAFLLWPLIGAEKAAVVLYSSVDQDQFKPVVADFERSAGLTVDGVGETEASRSVGMARRLELEKDHPVADVFWANEIMNTTVLRDLGVFAPLPQDVLDGFPVRWRDPKGRYVAMAGRARILLVNTKLVPDPKDWPTSVGDLLDAKWGGDGRRVSVAAPLTGTTYTHAIALLTRDKAAAEAFWTGVAARGAKGELKIVPGNGAVKQQVADPANGVAWGLTDTDDAHEAVESGAPVAVVYPDQAEGGPGTLVIPNTLALVQGGPHPEDAVRLLRWLASKETEARLAAGPIANIPVRDDVPAPAYVKRPGKDFRPMDVDWDAVGANRDRWQSLLQRLFASR